LAKHKSGGKITASHTSIIDAAFPVVEAAERLAEVTKISLGIIKQVGKSRGRHRIKFLEITGGWKLTVRGSSTIQELYVYSQSPASTRSSLESQFN
jgi:hypothetical protein